MNSTKIVYGGWGLQGNEKKEYEMTRNERIEASPLDLRKKAQMNIPMVIFLAFMAGGIFGAGFTTELFYSGACKVLARCGQVNCT